MNRKGLVRRRGLACHPEAGGAGAGGRGVRNSFHMMVSGLLVTLLFAALMLPGLGTAAETIGPAVADVESAAERPRAPVTLDGVTLFRVVGVSAYPAEQRAQHISSRIKAMAADAAVSTTTLRVVELPDRSNILAGDRTLLSMFDADALAEGVSRQLLAETVRLRIAEAIQSYRHDRNPRRLLFSALYALAATVALLGVLWGGRRAFRWLNVAVERRYQSRIDALQMQAFQLIQAEQLWAALHAVLKLIWLLIVLVLLYVYLDFVLSLFPWTRPLAERLLTLLVDPLRTMGEGLLSAVPNAVFIAILVLITRYALKLLRLFFASVAEGTITFTGFDPTWAMPTHRLVRLLVIVFAVVVAYPYIPGSGTEAFKGVTIFLGVIFSLGSSSVIANVIAGYTMTYRRAFRIGDRVKIGDHIGDVMEIRLLVTHLCTPKNEEIVVPNSEILNNNVINYSTLARTQGLILYTTVGIGYETPWRQVEAMLLAAADRTPGLLKHPPPFVLQKALGDFAVTYEINVYCDQPQSMGRLYTALHQHILDVFNEYGVQIMTPAYEGDPEQPKVVPKEQWFTAPAPTPRTDGTG
jgi:small-conductance mechanosensitive channel